jgi:hypothetical protein
VTETGPAPDTDQTFTKLDLKPKRVSAKIIVSSMLLSASPDAETLISGDLGKALSNQLDRAVLYGTGGVQPLGFSSHPDTHKIAFDATWWPPLTELEYQCAIADVSELYFGYIVSPIVRRELRRTMVSNGGTDPIWSELPNPISSNVVTGSEAFGGCWDSCIIATWGLEIIVNPYSQAHSGRVEIVGNLFCDVGLRHPKAFGKIG